MPSLVKATSLDAIAAGLVPFRGQHQISEYSSSVLTRLFGNTPLRDGVKKTRRRRRVKHAFAFPLPQTHIRLPQSHLPARPSPLLRAALGEVVGARPCHSHPSARTDCGRPSCTFVNAFGVRDLSILRNRDPGASATLTTLARICSMCDSTKTRRELRLFCVVRLQFDHVISCDSNSRVVPNTREETVRERAMKEWKGFW